MSREHVVATVVRREAVAVVAAIVFIAVVVWYAANAENPPAHVPGPYPTPASTR